MQCLTSQENESSNIDSDDSVDSYGSYIDSGNDRMENVFVRADTTYANNIEEVADPSNDDCQEESEADYDDDYDDYEVEDEEEGSTNGNYNHRENENSDVQSSYYKFSDKDHLPVHPNIQCSIADALIMIETYRIRHNLNWTAVVDLTLLINTILGTNALPTSKYLYKKKITSTANFEQTLHFCCKKCKLYLGTKKELDQLGETQCLICNEEVTTKTKYQTNFFITMPVEPQIKEMIVKHIDDFELNYSPLSTVIEDFRDGSIYQNIKQSLGGAEFISLTFNTDGGKVFEKVKNTSFWPLQFLINEFNLKDRFKRDKIMCAGYSYGKTPDMIIFLRPFIEEINRINTEGGIDIKMKDGTLRRLLVIPLFCTLDTIAKTHVMNLIQFNGHYGCPVCEHKGTLVKRTVRYCTGVDEGPIREDSDCKQCMIKANNSGQPEKGFKGLSVFQAIQVFSFDTVWQVVIDKMHAIDLGTSKKMLDLWLNGKCKKR